MEFYGLFDYAVGDDDTYKYSATEFSALIAALTCNGVSYNYGNRFNATYSGYNVVLASGAVFINGRYGYNSSNETVTIDAVAAGDTVTKVIVAELDTVQRRIDLKAIDDVGLTANQVALFNVTITSAGVSAIEDVRSYCYAGQNTPNAQIIYSATQPPVINGAVWLKPVNA